MAAFQKWQEIIWLNKFENSQGNRRLSGKNLNEHNWLNKN